MSTIKGTNLPSVDDWRKEDIISSAGTKGWNPLKDLPELLWDNIPDLMKFEIGFCSETDIPLFKTIGWVHMRRDHFEVDNFNQAIGLGLGLDDSSGVIKFRDNFLMIMPKDYRERVKNMRNIVFEESYERMSRATGTIVDRNDPEGEALLEDAKQFDYGLKEEQFSMSPKVEPKRRGRPPKNKD